MSSSHSSVPRPPRACELADLALERSPGSAILVGADQRPLTLAATSHRYGALVGVTCPPTIEAVAATHEAVLTVDGCRRQVTVAVAVTRPGGDAARFCEPGRTPRTLHDLEGPLADIGRLALGMATAPCARTPLDLLDAAFTESVLRLVLGAALGLRPSWDDISASHPLADSQPISAVELRARRGELGAIRWSDVRERITSQQCCPDGELTPALARWLDDGALARWLLARYPEHAPMFADVCELLDPASADAFRAAHAPPW